MNFTSFFSFSKAFSRMKNTHVHAYLLYGGYCYLYHELYQTVGIECTISSVCQGAISEKQIDIFLKSYHYMLAQTTMFFLEDYRTKYEVQKSLEKYKSLEDFQKSVSEKPFMYLPSDVIILFYDMLVYLGVLKSIHFRLKTLITLITQDILLPPSINLDIYVLPPLLVDVRKIESAFLTEQVCRFFSLDIAENFPEISYTFIRVIDSKELEQNNFSFIYNNK